MSISTSWANGKVTRPRTTAVTTSSAGAGESALSPGPSAAASLAAGSPRSALGSSPRCAIACTPRAAVHRNELISPALAAIPASATHTPSAAPRRPPPIVSAAIAKAPSL